MKVSLTDAEARMMRRTDGGTRSSVNIQVGIDAASGAVLYTDATDRANDYGLAVPALERVLKESSPPSFQTSGAAPAVTENAGGEVESCEGEVVAARDWHGACLPGSAFWK